MNDREARARSDANVTSPRVRNQQYKVAGKSAAKQGVRRMEWLDSLRAILGEVDEERGREVGDTDGRSRVLRWDPT